ncbi:MAG: DUF1028 domain-containing protein [Nanobdellota archaeon]
MTFSIIGYDEKTGEIGVATCTKVIACGSIVPAANENGAIATQSYPNVLYKEKALASLEQDSSPKEIIKELTDQDDRKEMRQVIIMNDKGVSAGFTGKGNVNYADHTKGKNYICAGNMLTGKEVLDAIQQTFVDSDGELPDRLMESLEAGEKAGGDKRENTKGSASLLVAKKGHGPLGYGDQYIDLRIDFSTTPINDLKQLLQERKKRESFYSKDFSY